LEKEQVVAQAATPTTSTVILAIGIEAVNEIIHLVCRGVFSFNSMKLCMKTDSLVHFPKR
jgi:hypothetical protein